MVLDLLIQGVELVAIPDKSDKTVAEVLVENVLYGHELHESLLTDKGLEFDCKRFLAPSRDVDIDQKKTGAFQMQRNGAVEGWNRRRVSAEKTY